MYTFNDIPRHNDGTYFLDPPPLKQVPVAPFSQGDRKIKKEILDEWFGVTKNLPDLPKYLIVDELRTVGKDGSNFRQDLVWEKGREAYLNGGWTVYEPVEWIPTIKHVATIPKSELEVSIERETTIVDKSKLYAGLKSASKVSTDLSYAGMKIEASVEVHGEVSIKLNTKKVTTIKEQGKLGSKPIEEIVLGMNMRMRRVHFWQFKESDVTFNHLIYPLANYIAKSANLRWQGKGDGQNDIPDHKFDHVTGLEYDNFGIRAQVLPAIDASGDIKALHVALRGSEWNCWYVYESPYGSPMTGHEDRPSEEIKAWTSIQPMATLMAID